MRSSYWTCRTVLARLEVRGHIREGSFMQISDLELDMYLAAGSTDTALLRLCCFIVNEDERIRSRVAENPRLPAEYLAELARDESPVVRISVADNLNTPVPVLELLTHDQQPDVRYSIAENPNTPVYLLESLLTDEHPYIVSRARKTLARLRCELPIMRHCA